MSVLYAAHLKHRETVAVMNVELGQRLIIGHRLCPYRKGSKIVGKPILVHQVVERLSASTAVATLSLLVAIKKALAQR